MASFYEDGCSSSHYINLFLKKKLCYYVKIYGPIGLDLFCIGKRLLCLSTSLQEWTTVSDVLGSSTKCSDSESFCCGMKTSFYLIKIPWMHDSRGITRSHFPWHQIVVDLVYFVYCLVCHVRWWEIIGRNMPSFFNWTRFLFSKCNIKGR